MLSKPPSPLPSSSTASSNLQGVHGRGAGDDASPVLHPEALAVLAQLDPGGQGHLIERVMTTFQTSTARLSSQLDAARVIGDRSTIRLVAHTLKSSSGYIGARRLVAICTGLEVAAAGTDAPDLGPAIDEMNIELRVVLAAIASHLASS